MGDNCGNRPFYFSEKFRSQTPFPNPLIELGSTVLPPSFPPEREEERRSRSFELGFCFTKDLIGWLGNQFPLAVRLVAALSFRQPNCFRIDIFSGVDTRNEMLRQQRTILCRQVPRLLLKLSY
jgi:hypothetical protein